MDQTEKMAITNRELVSEAEVLNGMATGSKTVAEEYTKCRVLKTVALYLSFGALGITAPIFGLSIVHMEYLLNTNTHTLAFTFTSHALGYILGGLICGLVYDHLNKEFSFSVCVLLVGISTIAAGFVGNIYAFLAVMSLQGLSMGFIDCAGQSYCIVLWQNHRLKDPILQGAHAVWSLAATIGPFVIRPFLVELASSGSPENLLNSTVADVNETGTDNVTFSSAKPETATLSEEQQAGIALAQFAYLTVGCLILCTSILFLVLYFYEHLPIVVPKVLKDSKSNKSSRTKSQKQRENCLLMMFLFMLFLFYFLYIYIEGLPLAYFTAFAIKYLGWSVHHATLLMALFYGMHCAGRVVGVPLSTVLKPRTMIVMNLLITAVAYILLLFVDVFEWVMWVSAVLSGYGMSSTFAAMVLWVSESVPITGRVASVLLVGGSVGGMTGPLIVGQLFDAVSPMWLVYILVVASLLHIALFLLLFFFVGRWKAKLLANYVEREVVHLSKSSATVEEKENAEQS